MEKEINYTHLVEEQFGLKPIPYFVFEHGFHRNENELVQYLLRREKIYEILEEKQTGLDIKKEYPFITVVLFCDLQNKCIIKAMSIRSSRDNFDMDEGISRAAYYALRHLKGRGVSRVKNPSSIRTLIRCCMGMTVHSVKHPKLNLFEHSLLQSKKKIVEDVQKGVLESVDRDEEAIRMTAEKLHKRLVNRQESTFSKLLNGVCTRENELSRIKFT